MPLLTFLLEFHLPAAQPGKQETGLRTIEEKFTNCLEDLKFEKVQLPTPAVGNHGNRLFMLMFTRQDGSDVIVRGLPGGLVTVDVNQYHEEAQPGSQSNKTTESLRESLKNEFSSQLDLRGVFGLPAIQRGRQFNTYFPTVDGLFIEYDFDGVAFEADSPYQNIKIMHSKQFGNMLLLDDDPNLAESDLAYTKAITGNGREKYEGATVLILGGGDGGILHELRKENPKNVVMVDIDEAVVNAAREHLRGICYDTLDQLNGDNYEVLIADCVPVLKQYAEEGRTFDFVINDLTAIPCSTDPQGDLWEFLRLILELSMKVLHSNGKYYAQGHGVNVKEASMKMYQEQLMKLSSPIEFKTETVFVPSYHEAWVFYEIWKKTAAVPSAQH